MLAQVERQLCYRAVENTLGFRNATVQYSSRKCACRRELNSHEVGISVARCRERHSLPASKQPENGYNRHKREPVQEREEAACGGNWKLLFASSTVAAVVEQGIEVEATCRSGAMRRAPCKATAAGRRRGVPRLLLQWRIARATIPCMKLLPASLPSALKPNPSLKASPNGGPPGPATGYGVHFPVAGPGVPPSVPP